jgi:hypothetical protein
MGVIRNAFRVLVRKPAVESSLGNLGIDGRITLKWLSEMGLEGVN